MITLTLMATLLILPFDNASGEEGAAAAIAPLLARELEAKGWRVVMPAAVEPLLEKNRVRYLDSLDDPIRKQLLDAAGAEALVSGTVYKYDSGRNPIVALSARMIRADGSLAWGEISGLSADETERAFGFGREATVDGVAGAAIAALTRRFPSPGVEAGFSRPAKAGRYMSLFRGGPISYRAHDLDPGTPHRICVLPFDNSGAPEGVRVVADTLALRLAAAHGFEVVEPAALRAAALEARIASFRNINTEELARLAPMVGTSLFLRGTIFTYADTSANNRSASPQLEMELTLIDVQSARVLWSAQHLRKGSDYTGFLMLGAVSNAVSLTDRVVAEMIDTATHGEKHESIARRRSVTPLARRIDGGHLEEAGRARAGQGQR
jgi:hypothetical protein